MLKRLYIKDYAIVEQLEIEFDGGFQVITGETGAGKSILVGALGLLCGERSQSDLVRSGANKAILEAEFKLLIDEEKKEVFERHALDLIDEMIIVRREINVKGTSRAFINDSPVAINTLGIITELLIDLHGQHQHQRLIHPENHISYLDAYGKIQSTVDNFKAKYQEYNEQKTLLDNLIEKRKTRP